MFSFYCFIPLLALDTIRHICFKMHHLFQITTNSLFFSSLIFYNSSINKYLLYI